MQYASTKRKRERKSNARERESVSHSHEEGAKALEIFYIHTLMVFTQRVVGLGQIFVIII